MICHCSSCYTAMFQLCWQTAKVMYSEMFFEIKSLFGTTKNVLGLCLQIQVSVFLSSTLIAALVSMRKTGQSSVLFFLWFASGCCEFGWAWKETCYGANVLTFLQIAFLSGLRWEQSFCLSFTYALAKCSLMDASWYLHIFSYWKLMPFPQGGVAMWVLLIC